MTRVIHIAGMPGSGKSMVAVNLAAALNQRGSSVIVLDADLKAPAVAHYTGIDFKACLNDYLEGKAGIDEILHSHAAGFRVIPSSSQEHAPNYEAMDKAILSLIGKADVVIVDSHTEALSKVMHPLDECFFVTNDDYHSVLTGRDHMRLMEANGIPVTGVIVNRKRKSTNASHIQAILGRRVVAEIPHDQRLIDCADEGRIGALHLNSNAVEAIKEFARVLS